MNAISGTSFQLCSCTRVKNAQLSNCTCSEQKTMILVCVCQNIADQAKITASKKCSILSLQRQPCRATCLAKTLPENWTMQQLFKLHSRHNSLHTLHDSLNAYFVFQVGSQLVKPLLAMITEMTRRQAELCTLLRKKDQEIKDYKESGARLTTSELVFVAD